MTGDAPVTSDDLWRALQTAVVARDTDRLLELLHAHRAAIEVDFDEWRSMARGLGPDDLDAYARTLWTIAEAFSQLFGDRRLSAMLTSAEDTDERPNPYARLERAEKLLDEGRFEEARELASGLLARISEFEGTGVPDIEAKANWVLRRTGDGSTTRGGGSI